MHPTTLQQLDPHTLGITWQDGHASRYNVRHLRLACQCAMCVDEMTGAPRLDPKFIPEKVAPTKITTVGNYAFHIHWTDGHQTGFFTFTRLRELCECDACDGKSSSGVAPSAAAVADDATRGACGADHACACRHHS